MKTTALLVQKLRLSDMLRGIGPSDVSQKKKTWRSEEGPQRKPTHAGPPLARGIKYPSSSDFAKRESKRIYSYTNLECLTSTDPHILFLEASPRPSQWLPPPTPSPSMAKDGCARSRSLMMPGTSPNHSPTLGSTLGLKNSSKAIQLPWTLGGGGGWHLQPQEDLHQSDNLRFSRNMMKWKERSFIYTDVFLTCCTLEDF